jgi:hypothetical protein
MPLLKLDEHVHIAIWTKVLTQNRTEQRELHDVVSVAELSEFIFG